jgi:hypothetical protein
MPSQSGWRRVALRVFLSILVVFLFAPTVLAQSKKVSSGTTTTGNSSWEQAIAVLQAQVDQQAQIIAQLQTALASETSARQAADATLQASDAALQNAINAEAAARQQGDAATLAAAKQYPDAAIAIETAARQAADTTLQNNINNEVAARQAAGNAEATARQQGDADTLAAAKQYPDAAIAIETAARQAADANLQGGLNAELAARQAADVDLQNNINNEAAARLAAVNAEGTARQQGDADTLAAAKQYADSVIGGETAARKQGDADTLAAAKQYADSAIGSEASARQAADAALQNNINSEGAVRQQGDINTLTAANAYTDTAFSTEAAAREAADVTLQNNINTLAQNGGGTGGGGGSNTGTVPQQLLDLAPYLSVDMNTVNGVPGPNVVLTGVNLHIRNGQPAQYNSWPTFDTASYSANGRGNLIVGYNDDGGQNSITPYRTGSHNIILGDLHRFIGNGAFVGGWANTAEANATAVAGYENGTSGWASTISGGHANFAVEQYSHVSGGDSNIAVGVASSVTGGLRNEADGNYSTISGGDQNLTTGFNSSVTGGENNWAKGNSSTVNGGLNQTADGDYSTAP